MTVIGEIQKRWRRAGRMAASIPMNQAMKACIPVAPHASGILPERKPRDAMKAHLFHT